MVDYGVIKPTGATWRERLIDEGNGLRAIIQKYSPSKVYIEDVPLHTGGGTKVLVILGAVQGFLCGLFASFGITPLFIQPSEWRSPLGLYDGKKEGTTRAELKRKSVELANKKFGLELVYCSPNSKKNDDDISDAILICYSQLRKKEFTIERRK